MAKTSILLLLFISSIVVVADQATVAETKLSPAAQKSEKAITDGVWKITNAVGSATPPGKQGETMRAFAKNLKPLSSALNKAKASGDDKRMADLAFSVEVAAALITRAPPDKRLKIMEDNFNALSTPDVLECLTVDKAFCETMSKEQKAFAGVIAAAPTEKMLQVKDAVLMETAYPARSTIDKAYTDGDEKKIAQVLAAYSKAADVVIAAAPADKFNVMEKTFADAGKN